MCIYSSVNIIIQNTKKWRIWFSSYTFNSKIFMSPWNYNLTSSFSYDPPLRTWYQRYWDINQQCRDRPFITFESSFSSVSEDVYLLSVNHTATFKMSSQLECCITFFCRLVLFLFMIHYFLVYRFLVLIVVAAGYLHMIHHMKELIMKAGKKSYTFVMGRPNPSKLANFPEVNFI